MTKLKLKEVKYHFRGAEQIIRTIEQAGFKVELRELTVPGREETWFIARVGQ